MRTDWASRPLGQFVLEGVFLPYEKRILVGYERFLWSSILVRASVGLLVFVIAGPVGQWLRLVDRGPIVDLALELVSLSLLIGFWRVLPRPWGRRRFTSQEEAAFSSDLNRYPVPAVNRWLSWGLRRISGARVPSGRKLLSMSIVEAAWWIAASVIAVAFQDANRTPTTPALFARLMELEWSIFAGMLITSAVAAVIRRYAADRATV